VYIAFSPTHKNSLNYAKFLSKGMIELKASGKLESILLRYGVKESMPVSIDEPFP